MDFYPVMYRPLEGPFGMRQGVMVHPVVHGPLEGPVDMRQGVIGASCGAWTS